MNDEEAGREPIRVPREAAGGKSCLPVSVGRRWFVALVLGAVGCRTLSPRAENEPETEADPAPLAPVKKAEEEVVVAAWSEPTHLPEGGGITQILVRLQKRGGKPYPGVEVRLQASRGTLYSQGRVLITDARGMTRDRLTVHKTSKITLNAGGTRYAFDVLVAPDTATR